mmetsp:Transcript_3006/g.4680  ORF Transcript_3006/g.4680 Transcript_3006/m.4680 type:complete len:88 (+) Transcript_3006:812-1075(+)
MPAAGTVTTKLVNDLDWFETFDAAFWIASLDSKPSAFLKFLKKYDYKKYRIVINRYDEYMNARAQIIQELGRSNGNVANKKNKRILS